MAMTAAQHFEKAEELLTDAARLGGDLEMGQAYAARAQAHLNAARLLLDLETSRNNTPGTAAYRSGLDKIAEQRRVN